MGDRGAAPLLVVAMLVLVTGASLLLSPDDDDDVTEAAGFEGYFLLALVRVTRDRALESGTRRGLCSFIQDRPGSTFTQVRMALGLQNGAAAYNINVLEKLGLVRSECEGRHRWYYPEDDAFPGGHAHRSLLQASVVEEVRRNPGIGLRELARAIDRHPSSVAYNVKALVLEGALRSTREGARLRIFSAEAGPRRRREGRGRISASQKVSNPEPINI